MNPNGRGTLNYVLGSLAVVLWLGWQIWPVSRELVIAFLVCWVIAAAWLIGREG